MVAAASYVFVLPILMLALAAIVLGERLGDVAAIAAGVFVSAVLLAPAGLWLRRGSKPERAP